MLFAPDGVRLGVYRQMHLFDVEVGDGQTYRESSAVAPGAEVVVANAPLGKVGLSVCYDLRFPELYRKHSEAGAVLLTGRTSRPKSRSAGRSTAVTRCNSRHTLFGFPPRACRNARASSLLLASHSGSPTCLKKSLKWLVPVPYTPLTLPTNALV